MAAIQAFVFKALGAFDAEYVWDMSEHSEHSVLSSIPETGFGAKTEGCLTKVKALTRITEADQNPHREVTSTF